MKAILHKPFASFETPPVAAPQDEGAIGLQDTIILMLRSAFWARLEARTSSKQVA
jgi:hypothetical protein